MSDKLYYNEHIQVFSIEIRPESIYPKFGASVPLPEAKKYANSRELWSLDIECTHPLQTVIISVVTDKMTVVKASENLVELR